MKAWARAIVCTYFIICGDILVPARPQCQALLGVSALEGKCALGFNGLNSKDVGKGHFKNEM